jgi:hypothetical protein
MRSAPPVLVPVGRFVWSHRIVLVLGVGTALACGGVVWFYKVTLVQQWTMAVVWLLAAVLSWGLARREYLAPGSLQWDGEAWWFQPQAGVQVLVRVTVGWDAGSAMLLGVRTPQPGGRLLRYAWLQATQMPAQWHALRCAVYACDTL